MKICIISVLLLLFSCFKGTSQVITDAEYKQMSALFGNNIVVIGHEKVDYAKYRELYTNLTFAHKKILSIDRLLTGNTEVKRVLILVKSSIYEVLSTKIERYAFDIHQAYGCEVVMECVSGELPEDIKKLITSNATNLNGVVLIGDIVAAWYEIQNDHSTYGYKTWPCDLYYMDLDGNWADNDKNGIYDTHTGNVQPEIFVGRISTSNMGGLMQEKDAMEKYLDKNHAFWSGKITVNRKMGLSYTDDTWATHNDFKADIKYLYGDLQYDSIAYGNACFGKKDYMQRLSDRKYEFVQIACHTYATLPTTMAMSGGSISSIDVFSQKPVAIGYNLYCCSACNWTVANDKEGKIFLAGAHIYSEGKTSLSVVGSIKTGGMLRFRNFYEPLGQGKSLGESFVTWWNNSISSSHGSYEVSWFYGMTIIGDPLVNFYYHPTGNCVSKVGLNNFNNTGTATHQYIVAKDEIDVGKYVIPSGQSVIFNAPKVTLNAGFKCQSGGCFRIMNEGCPESRTN